jgi:hypothetical protein
MIHIRKIYILLKISAITLSQICIPVKRFSQIKNNLPLKEFFTIALQNAALQALISKSSKLILPAFFSPALPSYYIYSLQDNLTEGLTFSCMQKRQAARKTNRTCRFC